MLNGKKYAWLSKLLSQLIGIDISEQMLKAARQKIEADHVRLIKGDLLKSWDLEIDSLDLITCSLVLEHVKNLDHIFCEVEKYLALGGLFYMCELHPFKQYQGMSVHHSAAVAICRRFFNFSQVPCLP